MSEIIDNDANSNNFAGNQRLPNAGGVLTLGILSIVFAGIIGLILGIIAISMSKKPIADYKHMPNKYDRSSYSNLNGGRICGIIGVSISGLAILIIGLVLAAN